MFEFFKHRKTTESNLQSDKLPFVDEKKNIVRCMIDGQYDQDGTVAMYENGTVYCISKYGDYIVGYYKEEDPGMLTVRARNDNEVIGYVLSDKIILTRKGQCDRFEKMGYPKHPRQMEWTCAERFSNCICELQNTECVALCKEDNWEAAAAFICMHYDGANTSNSEFHKFWYDWL